MSHPTGDIYIHSLLSINYASLLSHSLPVNRVAWWGRWYVTGCVYQLRQVYILLLVEKEGKGQESRKRSPSRFVPASALDERPEAVPVGASLSCSSLLLGAAEGRGWVVACLERGFPGGG